MLSHWTTNSNTLALEDLFAEQPCPTAPDPLKDDDDPLVSGIKALLPQLPPAEIGLNQVLSEAEPETLLQCAHACMARYLRLKRQAQAMVDASSSPRRRRSAGTGWHRRRPDRRPADRARAREVIKMSGVALGDHDLADGPFRTLCQLAGLCGAKGWCLTNWRALACLRGVDRKTIQRHVAELTRLGYIASSRPRRGRLDARVALAEELIPPEKPMPRALRTLIDGWRSRRPKDQDVVDRAVRAVLVEPAQPGRAGDG